MAPPPLHDDPQFHHVRSGVTAIIERHGKVIIGMRKASHGINKMQMPGGHQEIWEKPEACAERETFEETGLVVKAIAHGPTTDDQFLEERKHYKTLHIWCKMVDETAEPKAKEMDKCDKWMWKSAKELREYFRQGQAFKPLENLVGQSPENDVLAKLENRAEAHEKAVELAEKAKLAEQAKVDEQATDVEVDV
ncbi:NUDIX hydrolase domain-like protein [Colletotrichum acutatum]|uniref:NUDIX hydrolase domain-like protein n=1 Tax=Glomerella acutata TaxID=27357 RepID=A0AAD8UBS8_GLOAC|nr:NUDIX hydrolase domain-like protein [Colletotrichum acutatum]KAK1709742.1 NUDIX hydrolase domain-like protein [Colletotrichum acutatum]